SWMLDLGRLTPRLNLPPLPATMPVLKEIIAAHRVGSGCVLCGLLFLSLGGAVVGQEPATLFRKGPYLQGPGNDTITIKWESRTNGTSVVHYGLGGKTDREFHVERPRTLAAESY